MQSAVQISFIFTDRQRKKIQIFADEEEKVAILRYMLPIKADFAKKRLHLLNFYKKKKGNEEISSIAFTLSGKRGSNSRP